MGAASTSLRLWLPPTEGKYGEIGIKVARVGGDFFAGPSRLGEGLGLGAQFQLGLDESGIGPGELIDFPRLAVPPDQMTCLLDETSAAEEKHVLRFVHGNFVFELGTADPFTSTFEREPGVPAVGADAHRDVTVDGEVALAQLTDRANAGAPTIVFDQKLALDLCAHGGCIMDVAPASDQSGRGCELVREARAGQSDRR